MQRTVLKIAKTAHVNSVETHAPGTAAEIGFAVDEGFPVDDGFVVVELS